MIVSSMSSYGVAVLSFQLLQWYFRVASIKIEYTFLTLAARLMISLSLKILTCCPKIDCYRVFYFYYGTKVFQSLNLHL